MLGKMAVNMAAYPHIALRGITNDSVHGVASLNYLNCFYIKI
jgi:hypothetical protein